MYDNYPDDIRMYDHDPRSPFYVEPGCKCGQRAKSECNDDECGPEVDDFIEPDYEDQWET